MCPLAPMTLQAPPSHAGRTSSKSLGVRSSPARRGGRFDGRIVLVLCAVSLAGAALRLWRLDRQSLWWDEGFSVGLASRGTSAILAESFGADCSPPLYYLALHAWISLFGSTETAVRSLSVVLGLAAIPLLYRAGSVLFDRATGALAATLLAFSAYHVEYSQEARAYTLLTLLVLASMLAYLRLLVKADALAAAVYLLPTALLLYTHVFGIFFVAAQAAHFIIARLAAHEAPVLSWRRFLIIQLVLAAVATPIAYLVLGRLGDISREGFWLGPPTLASLRASIVSYAGSPLLATIFLASAAWSIAAGKASLARGGCPPAAPQVPLRFVLLLAWLVVPPALSFLISHVSQPVYHTRYTIGVLPSLLTLAAAGAMLVPRMIPRAALIALMIGLAVRSSVAGLAAIDKEPWRDVVAAVETAARPGDIVLADRPEPIDDLFCYYARRTDLITRVCEVSPPGMNQSVRLQLAATLACPGRVWLIRCRSEDHGQELPTLLREARPRVTRDPRWLSRRIEVILFEP